MNAAQRRQQQGDGRLDMDFAEGEEVQARFANLGEVTGDGEPRWSDWQKVRLFVQRYQGVIVCLKAYDVRWAEYDPRCMYEGDGLFVAEDYAMQLRKLEVA